MYCNGIIIRRESDEKYRGIDSCDSRGENWYLYDDPELEAFYEENIERTYYDMGIENRVCVCTDMEYIRKYIKKSQELGIKYRLLLCETNIPQPQFEPPKCERIFLGYDYAYTGGDYFSAVYNEVPYVFSQFKVNENELLGTYEEMTAYLAARQEFVSTHPPYTLEGGDFAVYRLWELKDLI